jgi:hypothetical protein
MEIHTGSVFYAVAETDQLRGAETAPKVENIQLAARREPP